MGLKEPGKREKANHGQYMMSKSKNGPRQVQSNESKPRSVTRTSSEERWWWGRLRSHPQPSPDAASPIWSYPVSDLKVGIFPPSLYYLCFEGNHDSSLIFFSREITKRLTKKRPQSGTTTLVLVILFIRKRQMETDYEWFV